MRAWITCIAFAALSLWSVRNVSATPILPTPGGPSVAVPEPGVPLTTDPGGSSHTSSPSNVIVNVTPPAPDAQATQAMMDYFVSNTEYEHGSVPVTLASGILDSQNIWTNTPWSLIDVDAAHKLRIVAKSIAMSLFLLGIIWTGSQIAFGTFSSTTTYMTLLPMVISGFLLAMYSDTVAQKMVDLNNWICAQFGNPSLTSFSGSALTLPDQPKLPSAIPGIVGIPAPFFSGLITSIVYAIVLIILELKMIFRDGVLIVSTTLMPITGVLWAFSITRSYALLLYRLFFGWLFGQPVVVVCLAIAGSILTFFNNVDGPAAVLVKVAVLFMAIKALTIFASGALGSGSMFGLAGLMLLMRRGGAIARAGRGAASAGPPGPNPIQGSAASSGQGGGNGATGKAWRPSYGTP